MQGKGTQI